MNKLSRRDLMIAAAACGVTPLSAMRLSAAELKVDLSNERVGQPPTTFQPVVGTWRVIQDGPDKVIMVDGQPWKANQNNRTALIAERARSFYNASQEDFIDNVKQFAYYPIATLNGVDNFSDGSISLKFKTVAGDLDRCSGILFNVRPTGDWLSTRYNDTEYNITLWTFHDGIRKMVKRGPGREPWHLARDQWHDLRMTVAGTDFKTHRRPARARIHAAGTGIGQDRPVVEDRQHELFQGFRRAARIGPNRLHKGRLVTSDSLTAPRSGPAPSPQPKSDLSDFGRSIK